jgi:hypothetical protein
MPLVLALGTVWVRSLTIRIGLSVFFYMKEYVDYEGVSEVGKWYMENMYVNLGFETKRYIDVEEAPPCLRFNGAQ